MNTIRCCISCILPCGSFDVIRIVHVNGHVEEISGTILASEIMKRNPNHVLKSYSSPYYTDGLGAIQRPIEKSMIGSPDVELQCGKIYFLVPTPTPSIRKDTYNMSTSSSKSMKKVRMRTSGHDVAWRPRLKTISEAM